MELHRMAATLTPTTVIPQGTWAIDKIHSSASFAAKHMVVSTFRGRFEDFDAVLTVDEQGNAHLDGTVDANSIIVKDENLAAHLKSPEFFDTEQYPEIKFTSLRLTQDGGDVTVEGDLTIKGKTEKVTGTGTIEGPAEDPFGNKKLGLALETVIDRTKFDLNWNAPLPKGGFALADDVKLSVELELIAA
jgi:polyisoprenoid-binding protein YceI